MKKTYLTFAALAFGMSVAIAQTTPVKEEQKEQSEQNITIDRMSDQPADETAGAREIKEEDLPLAVQRSLKQGEFKSWKVLTVRELQANTTGQAVRENMVNAEAEASETEAVTRTEPLFYEIELVAKSVQDKAAQTEQQVAEEGAPVGQKALAAQVPAVVVRYDAQGKLLSRVDRTEAPLNEQR